MDSDRDLALSNLLVQGQDGDQDAYEKFLLAVSSILRRFLRRRMGDADAIEDVLQESLLSIHRARHSYIPERPIGPWMYAICEHRMTDFYRHHRRVQRLEVLSPDDFHFRPSPEQTEHGECYQRVRESLKKLPKKQRQVIELLKIQDLSVKEVAAQTGMSESAVKVTAFRGYEAIRRIFGVQQK